MNGTEKGMTQKEYYAESLMNVVQDLTENQVYYLYALACNLFREEDA